MWYLLLGVEFTMSLELQVKVTFPPEENSVVPCLFALEVKYFLNVNEYLYYLVESNLVCNHTSEHLIGRRD